MSEAFTVTLNNSLTMSVVEHVDYDTGVIMYAVKGKRLSGTVILSPHYSDNTEIIPSRVIMESGHRTNGSDRKDILTINGIQLDCEQSLKPEEGQGREWNPLLSRRGLFGWKSRLPDATYGYAENVLDALATLWRKRTDIADLMQAAARFNASERLQNEKATTRGLTAYLQTVRAALAASEERITRYTKLQHEHQTKLPEHRQNDQCEPAELGGGSQSSDGEGMALDDRDKAILAARVAAFNLTEGPRVGDYVCFADGVTRRISYVWPDDIQTSDDGSFYLGKGYMSFSGALYTSVPTETLTLTKGTREASAWFFHHDQRKAHNSVHVRVSVRVWISSATAPRS